jgi:hypothetical protein
MNLFTPILFVVTLLRPLPQDSLHDRRPTQPAVQANLIARDSARAARADSLYQNLLERTNQQLSLGWTPVGTFIAALGVLFTVAAIAAAFLLYYQSRDYSQRIDEAIKRHESAIQDLIGARAAEMQVHLLARLDAEHAKMARLTQEEKDRLMVALDENQSATERQKVRDKLLADRIAEWDSEKREAEENIERLQGALRVLASRTPRTKEVMYGPPGSIFDPEQRIVGIKCSSCGIFFKIPLPAAEQGLNGGQMVMPCPRCGFENSLEDEVTSPLFKRRVDDPRSRS